MTKGKPDKRGRTPNTPPEDRSSQSSTPSPKEQPSKKKPTMEKSSIGSSEADMIIHAISAKLDPMQKGIERIEKCSTDLGRQVREVKTDLHRIEKQLLAKTVFIYGIEDQPDETIEQTKIKVQKLVTKMGIQRVDIDMVQRMGKHKEGLNRCIKLSFVRQLEKINLMNEKRKLREFKDCQKIFINGARTQTESKKFYKLRDHAREKQREDTTTKVRFIGSQILDVLCGRFKGQYHVDEVGNVVPWIWKEKPEGGAAGRGKRNT